MVYVAADLKCYRSAKKFNSTISKTLMLDTHSCVFLRISLSPNCLSNSELFDLCKPEENSWKKRIYLFWSLIFNLKKKQQCNFTISFFRKRKKKFKLCARIHSLSANQNIFLPLSHLTIEFPKIAILNSVFCKFSLRGWVYWVQYGDFWKFDGHLTQRQKYILISWEWMHSNTPPSHV